MLSSHSKSTATGRQLQVETQCVSARGELKSQTSDSARSKANLNGSSTVYLDQKVEKKLLQRKKEIIDKLMALIEERLEEKLEPFEEPCDGEGCSSRSHGSSSGKVGNPSKRQSIGQKRQLQRDDNDGNESDHDDGSRRNRNNKRPKTVPDDSKPPKYACPYYKYDPGRFGQVKTCCGPGWDKLHRVKYELLAMYLWIPEANSTFREHLMRAHSLPEYQCQRCFEFFKEKDELTEHTRATVPCAVKKRMSSPRNLADGFNIEQRDKLSKRTRGKPGHDKWIEWYCILFDQDPSSENIPSPCEPSLIFKHE